jgi:trans-2,3-dihydro-3-hydroxyanthranilate isomerase
VQAFEQLALFDPLATGAGAPPRAGVHRYALLDVFTDVALAGNQLAVFLDGRSLTAERMAEIAREMNLSETVFLLPAERGGQARARIFTPSVELPFAGHPLLGAAVIVGAALTADRVRLETQAGLVPVALEPRGAGVTTATMSQPTPSWRAYERAPELLGALGVERSLLPIECYENGPAFAYVALADEAALSALAPRMDALRSLGEIGAVCFVGSGHSWRVRVFVPGLGVPEDPATGSAAGPLAVHLSRHGRLAWGEPIEIAQGHELGRPSLIRARAEGGERGVERVEVAGDAVLLGRGELRLD